MSILAITHFPGRAKHFSYASLSEYTYLDLTVCLLINLILLL